MLRHESWLETRSECRDNFWSSVNLLQKKQSIPSILSQSASNSNLGLPHMQHHALMSSIPILLTNLGMNLSGANPCFFSS